jgi:phosphoribosyl 1,2-cyclic phosphate phosphodiesterase
LVILGSGTSFGVPVIGCDCAVCTSTDPRDRRSRSAAVVEWNGGARLLIDTPPEIRLQLVAARVPTVDAVLYTHDHADHVAGIDDLRALSVRRGTLPIYGPAETLGELVRRFRYIFDEAVVPREGTSKPDLAAMPLEPQQPVELAGVPVVPLELEHGGSRLFGYRIGSMAYITDAKQVPAHVMAALDGVQALVLNALFEKPHPTHLSIPEAIEVARTVGAPRTYLTHLTHRYSHSALEDRLPDGIHPAYDGLSIAF